jgi:hypothetical protein
LTPLAVSYRINITRTGFAGACAEAIAITARPKKRKPNLVFMFVFLVAFATLAA